MSCGTLPCNRRTVIGAPSGWSRPCWFSAEAGEQERRAARTRRQPARAPDKPAPTQARAAAPPASRCRRRRPAARSRPAGCCHAHSRNDQGKPVNTQPRSHSRQRPSWRAAPAAASLPATARSAAAARCRPPVAKRRIQRHGHADSSSDAATASGAGQAAVGVHADVEPGVPADQPAEAEAPAEQGACARAVCALRQPKNSAASAAICSRPPARAARRTAAMAPRRAPGQRPADRAGDRVTARMRARSRY